MKRNNDLIRMILGTIETNCNGNVISITVTNVVELIPDITQEVIDEHIKILVDSNFIEAYPTQFYWIIQKMTPAGFDFLENARDPHVWEKVKRIASSASLSVITELLKEAAINHFKKFIS